MRISYHFLFLVLLNYVAQAQVQHDPVPSRYSSVKTEVIKTPGYLNESNYGTILPDQKNAIIQYYDGLGRPLVQMGIRASQDQKDIVSINDYNPFGRTDTTFLPYKASTSDGSFLRRGQAVFDQKQYYSSNTDKVATDSYPFAVNVFDASPENYQKEQGAPGADLQPGTGHTSSRSSRLNTTNDAIRIWRNTLTTAGNYSANTLIIQETTDPDGHKVLTIGDKMGRLIEKRVQKTTSVWLTTLYIYDDLGRIAYVLQPEGVNQLGTATTISASLIDMYAFSFVYDSRGRLVEKKSPGVAPIYYAYDPLDRLVLVQDGTLRASNQWLYVKYDNRQRPIISGLYTNTTYTTRSAVQQNLLDGLPYSTGDTWYEKKLSSGTMGYSNQSFPTTGTAPFTINYYDSYDTDADGSDDFTYTPQGLTGEGAQFKTVGRITATKTLILGSSNWLSNYTFYDDHGRIIQVRNNNHLSSAIDNLATFTYNFDGTQNLVKQYHKAVVGQEVTTYTRYEYDNISRVKRIYHKINTDAEVLATEYEYNALGQVVDRKLHNTSGTTFLQSVDYRYTIQGWLASINNSKLNVDSGNNDDANDLFGMEFLRNTTESGLNNVVQYNGNISAVKWKGPGATAGTTDQRSYNFAYDNNNQMTNAVFQANDGTSWSKEANTLNETLSYDANGNTSSLQRNRNKRGLSGTTVTSTAESIDNLTYTYASGDGNKMSKIDDAITGTAGLAGFTDNQGSTVEYNYDVNGNLISDKNKGIDSVKYNELGKVKRVKFTDGRVLVNNYDATGTRIKMRAFNSSGTMISNTDYVGGFVYQNGTLSFFGAPEGRIVKKANGYERQYSITDHNGNTRLVFSAETATSIPSLANFEGTASDSTVRYQNIVTNNIVSFAGAATSGVKVLRMNSTTKIAATKSMRVYPGDKVDIEVYEYHEGSGGFGTATTPAATVINMVAGAFGGASGGAGESGKIYNGVSSGVTAFGSGGNLGDTRPAAYLNYILFDKDYNVLDMGWQSAPATTFTKQKLAFSTLNIKEAGYLFTYLSYDNSSTNWVYFDDLKVTLTPTNVVQYNEYYPFGLQTANSWTRTGATGNNYLFNGGSELNATSGWYDTEFRSYDPVLGRFMQTDPLASTVGSWSPYRYGFNNPNLYNDPSGLIETQGSFGRYFNEAWDAAGFGASNGEGNSNTENTGGHTTEQIINAIWNSIPLGGWGSFQLSDGMVTGFMIDNGTRSITWGAGSGLSSDVGVDYYTASQSTYAENGGVTVVYKVSQRQGSVILDKNGNIKKWDIGAKNIYVDFGDGKMELFRDGLARSKAMTPEAFSNGLLSIVNGMKLPNGYTFDTKRLYITRKIGVSLIDGTKAYTENSYVYGKSAYTLNSNQGLPKGMMTIIYQGLGGNLTVGLLQSILGYHEYYAHGIELLSHKANSDEINRIEKSYYDK